MLGSMTEADSSTGIAVAALIISGLSLAAALWSAWASHRALAHTRAASDRDRRAAFELERATLLEIINTSRAALARACVEIGVVKAIFDVEPQPVQVLLSQYRLLFSDYLPKLEGGVRQAAALWDEVTAWDSSLSTSAWIQHQARSRALLHEHDMLRGHAMFMVNELRTKLVEARRHVFGATR
jgi:hypothetical protein